MMQIIYTSFKKSKPKKKAGWKQREEEYQAWLKSHGIDPKKKQKEVVEYYKPTPQPYRRETPKIPSLDPMNMSPCLKSPDKVYTGTLIKGIGTMHKSNAVPIFSDEQAIEIATMRRN
jgi:hypothetical protein